MSKPDLDLSDAMVRRAVVIVASLNLAYFGVEFTVALAIQSVSLFADSVDFLEDAAVNFLIFVALAWTATRRATIGELLAIILVIPGLAFLWALWNKLQYPLPPEALQLGITGVGALVVNLICAAVLVRYRHHRGSLTKAAFLSAR
ncbi:MAG: cation transporter, partial [Povalibacter sp.]